MTTRPIRTPWLVERRDRTDLLVLGESHYCYENDDPNDPTLTIRVVRDVMKGERRRRFFTAVERAVTGHTREQINAADFFPTISFANFCQGCVDGSTKRPDNVMWQSGIDTLPLLLKTSLHAACWYSARRVGGGSSVLGT